MELIYAELHTPHSSNWIYLTVFYPMESPVLLMDTRMATFIRQYFDVKIDPEKGIVKKNVA